MIKDVQTMFYSSHVEELRAFIQDKLQLSFSDLGGGWQICELIIKSQ